MDLIQTPSRKFVDGDRRNPGTPVPAWWLNQLQDELASIVAAAGIDLEKGEKQVLPAILKILSAKASVTLATVSDIRQQNLSAANVINLIGYHADYPGKGGGLLVKSNKRLQDNGGTVICDKAGNAFVRVDSVLSIEHFGAVGNGELVTDRSGKSFDSLAIASFIDYANKSGSAKKCYFSGKYIIDSEIVLKTHAYLVGSSDYTTEIIKAAGYNGRAVVSDNFDVLKGTSSLSDPRTPVDFGLIDIKINGRYMNPAEDAYINTDGGGVYIYGSKYALSVTVFNVAGVGVYLDGSGDETVDRYRAADIDIRVDTTRDEGFIFKGPSDLEIMSVRVRRSGALIQSDSKRWTLWATPQYPDKQRVDAIVLDEGCEIQFVHTWGHEAGYGFVMNKGRLNADLIISESAIGGAEFAGTSYGAIDKLRLHNIKGGVAYQNPPHASAGTMPSCYVKTTGLFNISVLSCQRSGSGQTGHPDLQVDSGKMLVANYSVVGYGKPGHGVVHNGGILKIANAYIDQLRGRASDNQLSAALISNASGVYAYLRMAGYVVNTDIGFQKTKTLQCEHIDLQMRNVDTAWSGNKRSSIGQKWDICNIGQANKASKFIGAIEFDPLTTDLQKVRIAHGLIYAPNISHVQLTLADSPTSIFTSPAEVAKLGVYELDDTHITVAVQLKVVASINTTPRVNIFIEV